MLYIKKEGKEKEKTYTFIILCIHTSLVAVLEYRQKPDVGQELLLLCGFHLPHAKGTQNYPFHHHPVKKTS